MVAWLSDHQQVYLSPSKEPRYFDRDLKTRFRLNKSQYEALFQQVRERHRAIGEATVLYLYSEEAVDNIERELPGSRYIVMLRNPIDLVYSHHEQMTLHLGENLLDFESAWRASPKRRRRKGVNPLFLAEPRLLDYQSLGRLGSQLEAVRRKVDPERLLVMFLEDLVTNPRAEYVKVLDFLGLEDDGRTSFPKENPAKRVRSRYLQRLITMLMKLEVVVRARLGLAPTTSKPLRALNLWNKTPHPREPMPARLRSELALHFRDEVAKLEQLTGRDLSHWHR